MCVCVCVCVCVFLCACIHRVTHTYHSKQHLYFSKMGILRPHVINPVVSFKDDFINTNDETTISGSGLYTVYSGYSGHVYNGHSDIVATFPGTKYIYSIIFRSDIVANRI